MTSINRKFLRFTRTLSLVTLVFAVCLPVTTSASSFAGPEKLPKPEAWSHSSEEIDDDDYIDFFRKLIAGIVTAVIVIVAVCLVLCFCCPVCIIAKMRQRRGAVIRTGNGTTTVSNGGQTVTVTVNRSAPSATAHVASPVVAIPNNYNAGSKPYPVQESVTVVPLLQPQQPIQYPHPPQPMNIGYPPTSGPQYHPQGFELPPPYPGLPRDPESSNLPYNPYFTGDDNQGPNAPPK